MNERLDRTVSVTLDANGMATLIFAPARYTEKWTINRFTTYGNSTLPPTLNIYRGSSAGSLLDTTGRGNSAVSETDVDVKAGETITAVYSGGTPGAFMQFHLEGEISYGIS